MAEGYSNPGVIVMENSFHGRTLAALSATGNRKVQAGFEPLVSGFVRAPFDDLDAIRNIASHRQDIMAVQRLREQVKRIAPDAMLIFVLPPSRAEQERRLRGRGDQDHKVLARLKKAEEEEPIGRELADHVVGGDVGEFLVHLFLVTRIALSLAARPALGQDGCRSGDSS